MVVVVAVVVVELEPLPVPVLELEPPVPEDQLELTPVQQLLVVGPPKRTKPLSIGPN